MPITRREMLAGLALVANVSALSKISFAQGHAALRINPQRLQQSIEGLSVFGRPSGGTFADGVSRVAYSNADIGGRKFAMDLIRNAGLEPKIDAAGNIWAIRDGAERSLRPILFGSHIDSVPGGGNFDGDLGSMAAIEVMHTLQDNRVTTRHP